jgi:hypothetical protein
MRVSGTFRAEDRAATRYHYVPVDVPAGAVELRVSLDYDASAGVLDLGCFGPSADFRGYSGGARTSFAINARAATPGYLPGPLDPGEFHVLLGLHRVPDEGLPYTVTASTHPAASVEPLPVAPAVAVAARSRELPAPPGFRWLAGDLHAHTVHSDGALTVAELASLAASNGLDFLAVTDHNTVSHHRELVSSGIVLIPGQELTTDRGHANVFGDVSWVDFRAPADDWLSTVDAGGGLLSVNHPLGGDCAWLLPMRNRPPLAEVWHSGWWDRTWGAPLAWLLGWNPSAVPVGGSDFHSPDGPIRLGQPATWVLSPDRSAAGILDGLRSGRTSISAGIDGPVLVRPDDSVVALDADGTLLVDFSGRRRVVRGDRVTFAAEPGLHWLEDARATILAISA